MEYKTLSRGEGSGSASTKRATRSGRGVRKRGRKASVQQKTWGTVFVDAAEFAQLQQWMETPRKPTESIKKGAELIRSLYGKKT